MNKIYQTNCDVFLNLIRPVPNLNDNDLRSFYHALLNQLAKNAY